jgi:hypothetical protein
MRLGEPYPKRWLPFPHQLPTWELGLGCETSEESRPITSATCSCGTLC